ncbi:hypothetical protein PR002_g24215 [Phytophthora rubi]|uniref:Uncharacterized protein n=1 Tax=Phytophthora rubi TaxID=129364 RepID=A0A6A3II03_9STRA|nr:hypothetical protein PR002_g24215 [Phytophthora rubi]
MRRRCGLTKLSGKCFRAHFAGCDGNEPAFHLKTGEQADLEVVAPLVRHEREDPRQSYGWKVIAAVRDPQSATELKELKTEKLVQIDTSDEASITAAADLLKSQPIDLLINNAGIGGGGGIDKTTKAEMMKQFEVNAVGPFLMTRAFLPNLKLAVTKNGSATVGQVSSRMGSIADNGSGGMYGYRAPKTALNMVNSSLAADLKDEKIIALALHPG